MVGGVGAKQVVRGWVRRSEGYGEGVRGMEFV